MKREGKDFSRRVTPLFATMMVQANLEEGEDIDIPIDSQQTPITTQPSTSKPQKKKSRRKQKKNTLVPHPSDSTANVPNEEHVPTHSNDPLLSGEDRMKLTELMDMCTKLSERVLDLEHTKTTQAIVGVTRRVESSDDESLGAQEDASKQGRSRIEAIVRDAKVTLVETQKRNNENDDNMMFDTGVFDGDEIAVETEEPVINAAITTKSIPVSTDEIDLAQEITLAQALAAMKSAKPKEKDVVQESSKNVSTATTIVKSKDKGKAIMIEPENPLKKKDQIELDEEFAREIEAEEQQAMMEAYYELAANLQENEREAMSIEEKSRRLAELIREKKKFFAAQRAEAIRNKPPTKTQKRNQMIQYLKNMTGYSHAQLKDKSFDE
ncbi:hypothetical protein Tco_0779287, partial [Tanacetum coccineum]